MANLHIDTGVEVVEKNIAKERERDRETARNHKTKVFLTSPTSNGAFYKAQSEGKMGEVIGSAGERQHQQLHHQQEFTLSFPAAAPPTSTSSVSSAPPSARAAAIAIAAPASALKNAREEEGRKEEADAEVGPVKVRSRPRQRSTLAWRRRRDHKKGKKKGKKKKQKSQGEGNSVQKQNTSTNRHSTSTSTSTRLGHQAKSASQKLSAEFEDVCQFLGYAAAPSREEVEQFAGRLQSRQTGEVGTAMHAFVQRKLQDWDWQDELDAAWHETREKSKREGRLCTQESSLHSRRAGEGRDRDRDRVRDRDQPIGMCIQTHMHPIIGRICVAASIASVWGSVWVPVLM